MKFLFLLFIVVSLEYGHSFRYNRRYSRYGKLGEPHSSLQYEEVDDLWFYQKLDHFSDNPTTWKQRYFINSQYFDKSNGPIFLMIGGEGEASKKWMTSGAWTEYAKKFNALLIQIEHRFYGKSQPTEDLSVKNLSYLSSRQALNDLGNFREFIRIQFELSDKKNKWISFGGSYPGSLSAWFRLKYPHLVHAAISSSGPLYAETDFYQYLEVVQNSIRSMANDGEKCLSSITKAISTLEDLVNREQFDEITQRFKLCTPLVKDTNDIENFFSTVSGNFEDVVQYNRDNRAGMEHKNLTISYLCDLMTNEANDPLTNFIAVNNAYLSSHDENCTDFNYEEMIEELQNIKWDKTGASNGRQWIYQTCAEFGWYQSSTSTQQPFGHRFPIDFWTKQCYDVYGEKFMKDNIQSNVNNTNIFYGSRQLPVSRVVFVNGLIDPWHSMGIYSSDQLSPDTTNTPIIVIDQGAHCSNMYPSLSTDSQELKDAKQHIQSWIAYFLK
ncbi:hypothetical protein SNEBB_005366 [Seison nebaliae]|nr:hypothetical protein SNEBB_005366 [Seison nebaliae]